MVGPQWGGVVMVGPSFLGNGVAKKKNLCLVFHRGQGQMQDF